MRPVQELGVTHDARDGDGELFTVVVVVRTFACCHTRKLWLVGFSCVMPGPNLTIGFSKEEKNVSHLRGLLVSVLNVNILS